MRDAIGTFNVGNCYSNGIGAFFYYQTSADMGHVNGIHNNIGLCYRNGIGVEKDEHKAFFYFQKSAVMGNVSGTYNVGNCYHNGIGVEKD